MAENKIFFSIDPKHRFTLLSSDICFSSDANDESGVKLQHHGGRLKQYAGNWKYAHRFGSGHYRSSPYSKGHFKRVRQRVYYAPEYKPYYPQYYPPVNQATFQEGESKFLRGSAIM